MQRITTGIPAIPPQQSTQELTTEGLIQLLGNVTSQQLMTYLNAHNIHPMALTIFLMTECGIPIDQLTATLPPLLSREIQGPLRFTTATFTLCARTAGAALTLAFLGRYGITQNDFVTFLQNPAAHPSQQPQPPPQQPRITLAYLQGRLNANVTISNLGIFLIQHGITPQIMANYVTSQGLQGHLVTLCRQDVTRLLAFLGYCGINRSEIIAFLENPNGLNTHQENRDNRGTYSRVQVPLTQERALNLLALLPHQRQMEFTTRFGIALAVYRDFIMPYINAHPNIRPRDDHVAQFFRLLTEWGGTLPQLLEFLGRHGITEWMFTRFLENPETIEYQFHNRFAQPAPNNNPPNPSGAPNGPSNNPPPPGPIHNPPPKPPVRQKIEHISQKELNSLFSADINKARSASQWKHGLWKTAAITTLVAYCCLVIAGIVLASIFAPLIALPIVALAGTGLGMLLFHRTIGLYHKIETKVAESKKKADQDQALLKELNKLKKLSDDEFYTQYSHYFHLDKIDNPEIQTLLAEKGIDFYKPIIAHLNYYTNQFQQLEIHLKQLETTHTQDRDKIRNSSVKSKEESRLNELKLAALDKEFLTKKHTLQLDLAESKIHTAFIRVVLQEPWALKTKKLTDLCRLNRQDYLNANLAEHLKNNPSNSPKEAFSNDFALFTDKKISNLHLSKILTTGTKYLANHILGY